MTGRAQKMAIPWEDWSKDDPRLAKRISFSGRPYSFSPLYYGQLMEELTKQTGVSLTVTDRDGGAGEPLVVSLRNIALGDVLQSFWSLVCYNDATWRVTRTGSAPAFRYAFERPFAASNLCQKIQGDIQGDFEKYAANLVKGANLPASERENFGKSDPLLALHLKEEGYREGIGLFAGQTSAEQRLKILLGETELTVPVSELNDKDKENFRNLWKKIGATTVLEDGTQKPFEEPATLKFRTKTGYKCVTPVMFIDYGEMGALGYIGSGLYEDAWKRRVREGWILSGDDRERPEVNNAAIQKPDSAVPQKRKEPKTLFDQLDRFANAAQLSFMGHLPPGDLGLLTPKAQTVASLLAELRYDARISLVHKWREKTLLITYPLWFTQDAAKRNALWETVKELRNLKGNPETEELYRLAAVRPGPSFDALAEEFPATVFIQQWRKVLKWAGQFSQRREAFASKQGIPVTGDMLDILASSKTDAYQPQEADWIKKASRACLSVRESVDNKGVPYRLFQIFIFDKEGASLVGSGADFHPVSAPEIAEPE